MSRLTKSNDGCAPSARFERRVAEIDYIRGAGKYGADHFALHTDASSVNDPQSFESKPVRFGEIFLNNGFHVQRRDRVEVEHIRDWNPDRFLVAHAPLLLA